MNNGWPEVFVRCGFHLRRPTQERLQPSVLEHDSDSAGQGRIGPGRHVQGQHFARLDQLIEGWQALTHFHPKSRRYELVGVVGVVLDWRSWGWLLGLWRTEHPRHVRQVEYGKENGYSLDDARPDFVVDHSPVVLIPAIDGFDPMADFFANHALAPLNFVFDIESFELGFDRRRVVFLIGSLL